MEKNIKMIVNRIDPIKIINTNYEWISTSPFGSDNIFINFLDNNKWYILIVILIIIIIYVIKRYKFV